MTKKEMKIIRICECLSGEYSVTYDERGVSIWVDRIDDADNIRTLLSSYGICSELVDNADCEDDAEDDCRIDVEFCSVGKLVRESEFDFKDLNYVI